MAGVAGDARERFRTARAAVAARSLGAHSVSSDLPESHELAELVNNVAHAGDCVERAVALWRLHVAVTGALPDNHELDDALATWGTRGGADVLAALARACTEPMLTREVQCVSGTLVDVSNTSRTDLQAGVPRVVRELIRAWGEPPDLHYVVWEGQGLRTANASERQRLGLAGEPTLPPGTWVIPWDATFVVAEVLRPEAHASAVEAMASAGVVRLTGILYDLSALLEPHPDATRGPFLNHLAALARGTAVSAISQAVAEDAMSYFAIFARNGRSVPTVAAHCLPEEADPSSDAEAPIAELAAMTRGDATWPVVLTVSSVYRRKNHGRLLTACEQLWAEGLHFRLLIIEGTGAGLPAVSGALDRLIELGRPVTALSRVSEPILRAAYRLARVSAYVSLAEGYGLPIAESLAAGTPVLASGHGSMSEIGAAGGVMFVDPFDEESIAAGLRRVLTDQPCYEELVQGASNRPVSSWLDYAQAVGPFLGVRTGDRVSATAPEGVR